MGLAAAAAAAVSPVRSFAAQARAYPASFPSTDPERVSAIVGASHGDIEKVKSLLKESPELSKAGWDWGFGDWETALGAASHMGRKDIAEILMAEGARPDIFTFAMMGNLPAVKAAVEGQPGLQRLPGPHGIPLMTHAQNGKADKVVEYLKTLGGADVRATSLPVTEEEQAIYVGKYELQLEVLANSQGMLSIRRGENFGRVLNRVEEHGFAPGGAPNVRVRFKVESGRAVSLSVHEPRPVAVAKRV
jgi:hypothetical protein